MPVNVYIHFGSYTVQNTNKTWNGTNDTGTGTIIADMVDESNVATGFSLSYDAGENPTAGSTSGVDAVGSGDAAWVDEAGISDSFHYAADGHTTVIQFGGLDNAKTYDFELFSSWASSGNRRIEISIDGFANVADTLEASLNSTNVARATGVSPSSGVIEFSYRSFSDDAFAHCNAIWLQENDAGGGGGSQPPRSMHQYRMRRAA